jgi:hypothetical protein
MFIWPHPDENRNSLEPNAITIEPRHSYSCLEHQYSKLERPCSDSECQYFKLEHARSGSEIRLQSLRFQALRCNFQAFPEERRGAVKDNPPRPFEILRSELV